MREGDGDVVPMEIREVLRLFEEELEGVRFPDIDAEVLAAAVEALRERARRVDALRLELEAARADVTTAERELRQTAKRALGYARVFAEGNEPLTERLTMMSAEKIAPGRKPAKRRTARSKKHATDQPVEPPSTARMAELPFAEEGASSQADMI